jgi:anaerobic selenocysteine-containing dehydrogenase
LTLGTEFAIRAKIWVQLSTGSGLALALGIIYMIIDEGLFDKGCVDNWAAGFDKRGAHVQEFGKIGIISGVNQISTCLLMINHLTIKK